MAARVDWRAEKRLARQRARVMQMMVDPASEVTVELWLSSYLELFPSERSVKAEREHLSTLRAFRTTHGALKLAEVTPMLAQGWAREHRGHVRHLSRAWRKAMLMGFAAGNPWRMVERAPRSKELVRAPSELELHAIVGRCREGDEWHATVLADLVEVAAYTGARQGGLLGLRRSHVDLDAGERGRFKVTEKLSKERSVVLVGPARAAMERRLADYPVCLPARQVVFRNQHREPLKARALQEAWARVRGEFPHGFHSLRHYAATWLRAQGCSKDDVAIMLGHIDSLGRPQPQLQDRVYVHPDHEAALERIERAVAA